VSSDFLERLRVIMIGTGVGVVVQTILLMGISNGVWKTTSWRRKVSMALTGGVAALVAGFGVMRLEHARAIDAAAWDALTAQIIAAIAAGETIRRIRKQVKGDDKNE
jgi:hypothetical protein